MPSNPPGHNNRPVVLGIRFDAVTAPQALDRFFELDEPTLARCAIITSKQNLDINVLLKDQTFLDLIGRNEYQGIRWFRGEAFQECMYLAVFTRALTGKGKLSAHDEMIFRQEIDKWLRRCAEAQYKVDGLLG